VLLCFPAAGDVGVTPEPKMAYTPLVYTPHNYYTIATQSISLGGKRLVINQVRWEPRPTTLPAAPPPQPPPHHPSQPARWMLDVGQHKNGVRKVLWHSTGRSLLEMSRECHLRMCSDKQNLMALPCLERLGYDTWALWAPS
jgi:hypothetical protein